MNASTRYMQSPDVLSQESEDSSVLVNLDAATYHRLNRTARDVWNALNTPRTVSEVSEALREIYSDLPPALDAEVDTLIEDMITHGLVVEALD